MEYTLATAHLCICLYLIRRIFVGTEIVDFQMGVIGAFSIGYYPLPVFFSELSRLDYYREEEVFFGLLIHTIFIVFCIFGTYLGKKFIPHLKSAKFVTLDQIVARRPIILSFFAFATWVVYYSTQDITSYSSENFEAYFHDRSPFLAAAAAFAGIALSLIVYSVAVAWRDGNKIAVFVVGTQLAVIMVLMLGLGQRLIALTPIMMLVISFLMVGRRKFAMQILSYGILFLLVFSPFAVYLREARADRSGATVSSLASGFSYEGGIFESSFNSIVDRADLVKVTIQLKSYIDAQPAPGFTYYESIALLPVPKFIIGDKPYLLSTDGTMFGEISVLAWKTLIGGTGSLSAFGGLVAYREGGWLWIPFNAIATGVFFVFLTRLFAEGGAVAQILYANFFVLLSIKKVPPSFFEAFSETWGLMPLIVGLALISWLLGLLRATHHRDRRRFGGLTKRDEDQTSQHRST